MAYLNYVTELYPDSVYPERMSVSRRHHPSHSHHHGHHVQQGHHHQGLSESPLQRFNVAYPPRLGAARSKRNRFKTQPITFDEIKEVDEDEVTNNGGSDADGEKRRDSGPDAKHDPGAAAADPSELLQSSLTEFSQAMEGLVALKFDSKTAETHEKAFASRRARLARARRRRSTPDTGLLPEEDTWGNDACGAGPSGTHHPQM